MLCSFSLQLIFFSEQPFYGNYSTLDSHTNTVISYTFAYSSRWRRRTATRSIHLSMSKEEKKLSTTPWITEETLAKINYAPRQTQDPTVLILTQNFYPRQIQKNKTGINRAAKIRANSISHPVTQLSW